MATSLLNRAQISYTYGTSEGSAVSNQTNTTLVDQYTMTVVKETLTPEIQAGNNAAFYVLVDNTGIGTLSGFSIEDDLGMMAGAASAPLSYVENSAVFMKNGEVVTGTASTGAEGVTFATAAELAAGDSLMVIYLAEVDEAAAVPITNTATVTANTTAVEKESVIASASATVTPTAFADISIFKAADTDTVVSGDTLTYTFTLMNTGFDAAEDVVFTDAFPAEFGITGVSYTIDGVTTPVDPADYTVSGNTLTLPAETSALALGVAPATETGPGMTVITVTGTIA